MMLQPGVICPAVCFYDAGGYTLTVAEEGWRFYYTLLNFGGIGAGGYTLTFLSGISIRVKYLRISRGLKKVLRLIIPVKDLPYLFPKIMVNIRM